MGAHQHAVVPVAVGGAGAFLLGERELRERERRTRQFHGLPGAARGRIVTWQLRRKGCGSEERKTFRTPASMPGFLWVRVCGCGAAILTEGHLKTILKVC